MAVNQILRVRDLMTEDPIVVSVDTPLVDIAEAFDRLSIHGAPVVDWSGFLVGVISETDLVHARASEELWPAWSRMTARHLMTEPPITVTADASLDEAARLMEWHKIHRLIVVGPDVQLPIGIISASDVVRALGESDE